MQAIDYAKMALDTIMYKFPPEKLPPARGFHYHQGVFLRGMEEYLALNDNDKYNDYLKSYVDLFIDEDGNLAGANFDEFDDLQPLNLVFRLYDITGDEKYAKVLDNVMPRFLSWRTNSKGGFWHKIWNPCQLWLDTLYMSGPLAVHYGVFKGKTEYIDLIFHQMRLIRDNMRDSNTGLLYHAWDELKKMPWADKKTGLASCFWGRATAWLPVAMVDMLDYVPIDYPAREEMLQMLRDVLSACASYQDEASGMWYQVLNRGNDKRNWHETSCTCLFAYAMLKGAAKGYIDKSYVDLALRAYNGVLNHVRVSHDMLLVDDICIGTGVMNYDDYLTRATSTNDLHGVGAFVMMCSYVAKLNRDRI